MASFAPPKTPSSFTVGKAGQDPAEASRRRNLSSSRRNRSPSPLSRETLNGGRGGHAFNFCGEDAPTPLSAMGSLHGRGAGSGGGEYSFGAHEGAPTPLSISQTLKARGIYSFNRGHDSTAATVSPTGDEKSSGFRSSAAAGAAAASSPSAATDAEGTGARSPDTTVPTFSEIARGATDRYGGGGAPLSHEPFARARVRAAEEGWARREAERREREKRWRLRALSVAILFVLVAVLVCRFAGVAITISGPPSRATTPAGAKTRKGQPAGKGGTSALGDDLLAAAAAAVGKMPAIVSSKEELVAALKLAGAKKPKPAQVDRAWSALVSGEARAGSYAGGGGGRGGGDALGVYYYARGFLLALSVAAAAVLRNPDFGVVLAVTLAAVTAATFRVLRSCGWRSGTGERGGEEGVMQRDGGGGRSAERIATSAARGTSGGGAIYGGCSATNGTVHERSGRRS